MNRIRELRKAKRITQEELANAMGVSQITISHWENDRYEISHSSLLSLAEYFGVSVDYLLGLDEPVLVNNDPELTEYLEQLKNRPEMRMLFSLTKTATKKDVEKAVEIIEAYLRK